MKITFLLPHIDISGGVKAVINYSNYLTSFGHKVSIVCPYSKKYQNESLKKIYVNLFKIKPEWKRINSKIIYVDNFLEKNIPNADIIISTAWQTAKYSINYKHRKGKKIYFIQHYESLYHGDMNIVDKTYNYPIKKIVISSYLQELLKNKFNADSSLIVTPVDKNEFYPSTITTERKKRVCMLHHTAEWKGFDIGLKAVNIAQKKDPSIKLVVFGAKRKELEFDGEYYFRPKDINKILNSCPIYICNSEKEGLGMVSMEAMASRCALITTDNGGCRNYAIHNNTAIVVPYGDQKILAEKIIFLLNDKYILEKLSTAGYNYIKKYTWKAAASKFESICLNLL